MNVYKLILLSILLFLLCGCQEEVMNTIEVTYENESVLTITDPSLLTNYQHHLLANPTTMPLNRIDLYYTLTLTSSLKTQTYKICFDMTEERALAISQEGTFEVPYKWLIDFTQTHSLEHLYTAIQPPNLTLTVNGDALKPSYEADWIINPTSGIIYEKHLNKNYYHSYYGSTLDMLITSAYDLPPNKIEVRRTYDDQTQVATLSPLDPIPTPLGEGLTDYVISASWDNDFPLFSGTINYNFSINVTIPATYSLNKTVFEPGDCMAIRITKPADLDYSVKTATYDKTIGLFYYGTDLVGLIPLDSRTKPAVYELNIYKESTGDLLQTLTYEVVYKEFDSQQLAVNSSTTALKTDDNYAKDAIKFGDAKTYSVGEKLWNGTFLQPVQGRISTEYAMIRYINGNTESSRHSGLDIAAPTGTPVLAANNGIVTFASDLIVSGNVVVLDHGYGLFTSYVHMDKIHVNDGQKVIKGDMIGEVGSTGYSTGPHLHWTVWKNGVYLNPWKFIEEDPLASFD